MKTKAAVCLVGLVVGLLPGFGMADTPLWKLFCDGHHHKGAGVIKHVEGITVKAYMYVGTRAPKSGDWIEVIKDTRRDLGCACSHKTVYIKVKALDKDTHVCEAKESPVENYIEETDLKVDVKSSGFNTVINLSSPEGSKDVFHRTWTASWDIPDSAAGEHLTFTFGGQVDDMGCDAYDRSPTLSSVKRDHTHSKDEPVEMNRFAAELDVVKVESIEVRDKNHPTNSKETTGVTVPDLYVGETANDNAAIQVIATILPDTPEARGCVNWEISGNSASPDDGDFGSSSTIDVTISESFFGNNNFVVKAGCDCDDDNSLDSAEVTHSVNVHLVQFHKLKVYDKNHTSASVTVNESNSPEELYICENRSGDTVITMEPDIDNDTPEFRSHVLWTVTGDTATQPSGTFQGGNTDITLAPAASNTTREFVIKAGIDDDNDGSLDTTEVQYEATVVVVKLEKIRVRDKNHPTNSEETTGTATPDIYVGETANDNAVIQITATILPDTPEARAHVNWKLSGNSASPDDGNCGSSSTVNVTISESFFGNNNFVVKAGCDCDDDNSLDSNEVTHSVNVHLVQFHKLTAYDKNETARSVTVDGAVQGELIVWENTSGDTIITMKPDIDNDTPEFRAHVLWAVSGATATQPSGTFQGGNMDVTLAPATSNTAREFIIKAGTDDDNDGTLGVSEKQYEVKVIVVKVEVTEVGFTGDHMITEWGGAAIDSPDGTAPVWTRAANPDDPVCYTKNTAPTMFAVFEVSPTLTTAITGVRIRAKVGTTIVGSKTGCRLSGAAMEDGSNTDGDVDGVDGGNAVPNSDGVKTLTPTFSWEGSFDGSTWHFMETTAAITMHWTDATPAATILYNLGLEKACGYVAGSANIPGQINSGLAGEINYDPAAWPHQHTLGIFAAGEGECCCHAAVFCILVSHVTSDSPTTTDAWGGCKATTHCHFEIGSTGWHGPTFRCDRPAYDSALANPHFNFHVEVTYDGTTYDPSYGMTGWATFTEMAPVVAGSHPTAATQQTGSYPPAVQHDVSWTCPH